MHPSHNIYQGLIVLILYLGKNHQIFVFSLADESVILY